ncbi:MAG: YabP/YqfC family sporulation protein [Lachnospiraceae bacterium]|nr:YabP/YqfC family sporulation protein [Clostridiales bacterium]MDY3109339.1 YabP/YqfC family sporulation protein [Lachnospiraceae bacterium]
MNHSKYFNVKKQKETLTNGLKLPTECITGDMVITMTGNRNVYIESYRGILEYTSESLVLKGKQYCVKICGEQIHIDYYTEESMRVSGMIRSVHLGCLQTI